MDLKHIPPEHRNPAVGFKLNKDSHGIPMGFL